jgi:hypothetical protein
MNTKWRFQQMVDARRHIGIESWVQVAQNKLFDSDVFLPSSVSISVFAHFPIFMGFFVSSPHRDSITLKRNPLLAHLVSELSVPEILKELLLMLLGAQQILFLDYYVFKMRFQEVKRLFEHWVKRVMKIQLS